MPTSPRKSTLLLILGLILCSLGAYVLILDLIEAFGTGVTTHPRSGNPNQIVEVSADPLHYWYLITMQISGVVLCVTFASLSLWSLIKPLSKKPPLNYGRSEKSMHSTLKNDRTI